MCFSLSVGKVSPARFGRANTRSLTLTVRGGFLFQRLAESAEDADLYHEFNATLKVSASGVDQINVLYVLLTAQTKTTYINNNLPRRQHERLFLW